jgi:tetratricopeptide (TPR) repeat protein
MSRIKGKYILLAVLAALATVIMLHFIPLHFINYQALLGHANQQLQEAKDRKHRFYALTEAAWASAELGQFDKAENYANELLRLSRDFQTNWNYGNALHYGHIALGIVSLSEGNISEASSHLLEAGRTPGSPQLDSAGPDMTLARRLLKRGEKDEVLVYLSECGRFWKNGHLKLLLWRWEIKLGLIPAFNRF